MKNKQIKKNSVFSFWKGKHPLHFSRKNNLKKIFASQIILMLGFVGLVLSSGQSNQVQEDLSRTYSTDEESCLNSVPQSTQNYPEPKAQFTHVYYNDTVSVTSLSKGDDTPLTLQWSFGDGTNITGGVSLDHIYLDDGNYTVQLEVVDNNGDFDIATQDLEVKIVYITLSYNASDPNSQGITIAGGSPTSIILIASVSIIAFIVKAGRKKTTTTS